MAKDSVQYVSDDEWEVVAPESGEPVKFTNKGDSFIGVFTKTIVISFEEDGTPQSFNQHIFADSEGAVRTINGGYKFDKELAALEPGSKVRITYVGDVDTGRPSPMKDYRIEVAKKTA